MTPTLQDFYAECVARFGSSDEIIFEGAGFEVFVWKHGEIGIDYGQRTVYSGTDIRRAASILYGITGNENWLKFVTGERE